jgi:hypothetical protein
LGNDYHEGAARFRVPTFSSCTDLPQQVLADAAHRHINSLLFSDDTLGKLSILARPFKGKSTLAASGCVEEPLKG